MSVKILSYLLAISILLLIVNIILDKFTRTNEIKNDAISIKIIDSKFEKVLSDYGLEKDWITVKFIKNKNYDSLIKVYNVNVPSDLSLPLLLSDINYVFSDLPIRFVTKEKVINQKTRLEIYSGQNLMLWCEFKNNPALIRNTINAGFILTSYSGLDVNEKKALLNIPEQFAVCLIPSTKAEQEKQDIVSAGKEYIILINDDINEVKYMLKDDYSVSRKRLSINNLISAFHDTKLFAVDDKSDFFKSPSYAFLKIEFGKRNLKLPLLSNFNFINNEMSKLMPPDNQVPDSSVINKVFVTSTENYLKIQNSLEAFRKRGSKFIFPSSINFNLHQ